MRTSQKFFSLAAAAGALAVFIGFFGLIPDWTPYRYGQAGAQWLLPQLTAGVLLLYSGASGWFVSRVTPESAPGFNMAVFWAMLLANLVMNVSSISLIFIYPDAASPARPVDEAAMVVAICTNILAMASLGLCAYYGIWVHRMRTQG